MNKRKIGNTELETPPIIFGGNVFGWTLDKKASFRMLDMLLERGYTFIDTADVYGAEVGLSEKIIGQWMKDRHVRDKITIATKGGRVHFINKKGKKEKRIDNSASYLQGCIVDSLKRLQTDYIDLYYTHFDDKQVAIEEALEIHKNSIKSGKVRFIGASNFSPTRLKKALDAAKNGNFPRYEIFQTDYSLVERKEFETGLREICDRYNISVASYFSLASGFLTGKYRKRGDFSGTARQRLTEKYFNDRGKRIIETLDEIAEENKVSNAGVALGWVLQRPKLITAVASATKENHLDAFDEAVNLQLSDKEMQRLNQASAF